MRLPLVLIPLMLLAAACLGGEGAAPAPLGAVTSPRSTATPSPTPTVLSPTATPSPTPSPTPPPPPALDLAASVTRQGGFLLVRLLNPPHGLSEAAVQFAGASYPMLPEGDPSTGPGQARWYAVIGLGVEFAPGDYPLAVTAGETLASTMVRIEPGTFEQEYIELPPESLGLLSDAAAIEEERRVLEQLYAGFTPERLWSGVWIVPAQGPVSNTFGLQRSINGGPFSPHTGTDIAAEAETPVAASASGRVALAGPLYLRGNSVIIDHGAGVFTGYHHLDRIAVTEGQSITKGDLVGYVGATGLVSGAHLHWEAVVHGVRVDPSLWTQAAVEP